MSRVNQSSSGPSEEHSFLRFIETMGRRLRPRSDAGPGRTFFDALLGPSVRLLDRLTQAAAQADPRVAAGRLFLVTLAFLGLGFLIQVSHAATTYSAEDFRRLLLSQAGFRMSALCVLVLAYRLGPQRIRRFLPHMVVLVGLALIAVYFPPFSDLRNGSRRWLDLHLIGVPLKFQPSELARVVIVLWIADRCVRLGGTMQNFRRGVLPMLCIVLSFFLLIGFEKDLGGAMLFMLCAISTIWVGGAKLRSVGTPVMLTSVCALLASYQFVPYMRSRMDMFLGRVENDQVNQTLNALSSGGIGGAGYTQGLFRNNGVPYLESDYVFALIGEELGLLGMWLVLALLVAFLWFSVRLVLSLRGGFNSLAAFGLLLAVSLQAMLHVQVVSGLAPPKGMTLPFLSHGGTSLIVSALAVGLALGAARNLQEKI